MWIFITSVRLAAVESCLWSSRSVVRDAWAGQADCDWEAEHVDREDYRRILANNQEPGTLALLDCSDMGSAYGLVIEYGGERTRFENFVSDGATRRALQMVENDAEVGIAIRNFTGPGRNSLYPGPPRECHATRIIL